MWVTGVKIIPKLTEKNVKEMRWIIQEEGTTWRADRACQQAHDIITELGRSSSLICSIPENHELPNSTDMKTTVGSSWGRRDTKLLEYYLVRYLWKLSQGWNEVFAVVQKKNN